MTTHTIKPAAAVSVETNINGGDFELILTFGNGVQAWIGSHQLTPALFTQCAAHGLKQKLVDAAAIARNTETGLPATNADKQEAVMVILERIKAGFWNKQAGEAKAKPGALFFRALCRFYEGKMDAAGIKTWMESKTKEQLAGVKTNPRIVAIMAALKLEDAEKALATSGTDSDALLDAFDNPADEDNTDEAPV